MTTMTTKLRFGDPYFVLKFRKDCSGFLFSRKIKKAELDRYIEEQTKPVSFDKVIKRFCGG